MKNLKVKSIVQYFFVLSLLMLLSVPSALAQGLKVAGTVTDTAGEPIIGASVMEKGTTNGTISDFDGNFSLTAKKGATLVISYVGYITQEVAAAGKMDIVLKEDSKLLDDVIVVGYGVQKKSSITGAISKVDESEMRNRTITSAQDALAGKTSGVQMISSSGAPGEASSMRIRGYSSNYSSEPLYVVDGLKVSNISNIDPNDIESIEVLKDAASAAIYGAEAGNGVVLVTTKRAQKGKTRISYDFQYSANTLAHMPEVMNAKQYIQFMKEGGVVTDDMLSTYYDGVTDNQWYKTATETGAMMKHTLSLESANDKNQLFISLNYLDNDGYLKGDIDTHKRYNLTVNGEMKLKKSLTVGLNSRISYSDMNTKPYAGLDGYATGPFTSLIELDPLTPVYYDSNNLPAYIQTMLAQGRKLPQDADGRYFGISQFVLSTTTQNPLQYQRMTDYKMEGSSMNTTMYVNSTPLEGLVITTRLGVNLNENYTKQFSRTYYASSKQNNEFPTVSGNTSRMAYYQLENFANYTKTLGDHTFGAMVGMSFSKTKMSTLSASANNIAKELDQFTFLNYAAADATKTVGGETRVNAKYSYFGRLNYSYADRYLAEVTMRADAADLSVLSKEQRWGYFPAFSLGWVASNEAFFPKNQNAWTYAKLRASWGQNGSISNLSNYMYASAIQSNSNYSFDSTTSYFVGSSPTALGNKNLKWETSEQLDFGLDLRFLNDRLTVTADYYVKKTKDLLISGAPSSLTAGNTPSPINAGNVENKGFDLDLGWKSRVGKDFTYSINANIATLKNKVTYLDPTIARLAGSNASGMNPFTYFEVGYPIWYMRGYRLDHVDSATGDPVFKDLNGDGQWTAGDMEMIGSAIPDFTYGITLNMAYKGLDLVIFGSGSQGNDIYNNMNSVDDAGANKLIFNYNERWTPTNTTATRPRPKSNYEKEYYMSDAMVFDGSYFKIKQIQLGYTLPKSLISKIGLENLRAYVSLDDFFTFTSYPGMDPETASHNSTSGIGIDSGSYASSKKVVFGFNVAF